MNILFVTFLPIEKFFSFKINTKHIMNENFEGYHHYCYIYQRMLTIRQNTILVVYTLHINHAWIMQTSIEGKSMGKMRMRIPTFEKFVFFSYKSSTTSATLSQYFAQRQGQQLDN